MIEPEKKLFKSFDVLWEPIITAGRNFIGENPFCANCRNPFSQKTSSGELGNSLHGWYCSNCDKNYVCPGNDYSALVKKVRDKYEGYKMQGHVIYSLDLPPTKVVDDAEDENYWVQARISEKNGKRMAVIYFGERVKEKQSQKDYAQIFLDFEDEQLRFDKSNKNPMKLLGKLTAEFTQSTIDIKKNN